MITGQPEPGAYEVLEIKNVAKWLITDPSSPFTGLDLPLTPQDKSDMIKFFEEVLQQIEEKEWRGLDRVVRRMVHPNGFKVLTNYFKAWINVNGRLSNQGSAWLQAFTLALNRLTFRGRDVRLTERLRALIGRFTNLAIEARRIKPLDIDQRKHRDDVRQVMHKTPPDARAELQRRGAKRHMPSPNSPEDSQPSKKADDRKTPAVSSLSTRATSVFKGSKQMFGQVTKKIGAQARAQKKKWKTQMQDVRRTALAEAYRRQRRKEREEEEKSMVTENINEDKQMPPPPPRMPTPKSEAPKERTPLIQTPRPPTPKSQIKTIANNLISTLSSLISSAASSFATTDPSLSVAAKDSAYGATTTQHSPDENASSSRAFVSNSTSPPIPPGTFGTLDEKGRQEMFSKGQKIQSKLQAIIAAVRISEGTEKLEDYTSPVDREILRHYMELRYGPRSPSPSSSSGYQTEEEMGEFVVPRRLSFRSRATARSRSRTPQEMSDEELLDTLRPTTPLAFSPTLRAHQRRASWESGSMASMSASSSSSTSSSRSSTETVAYPTENKGGVSESPQTNHPFLSLVTHSTSPRDEEIERKQSLLRGDQKRKDLEAKRGSLPQKDWKDQTNLLRSDLELKDLQLREANWMVGADQAEMDLIYLWSRNGQIHRIDLDAYEKYVKKVKSGTVTTNDLLELLGESSGQFGRYVLQHIINPEINFRAESEAQFAANAQRALWMEQPPSADEMQRFMANAVQLIQDNWNAQGQRPRGDERYMTELEKKVVEYHRGKTKSIAELPGGQTTATYGRETGGEKSENIYWFTEDSSIVPYPPQISAETTSYLPKWARDIIRNLVFVGIASGEAFSEPALPLEGNMPVYPEPPKGVAGGLQEPTETLIPVIPSTPRMDIDPLTPPKPNPPTGPTPPEPTAEQKPETPPVRPSLNPSSSSNIGNPTAGWSPLRDFIDYFRGNPNATGFNLGRGGNVRTGPFSPRYPAVSPTRPPAGNPDHVSSPVSPTVPMDTTEDKERGKSPQEKEKDLEKIAQYIKDSKDGKDVKPPEDEIKRLGNVPPENIGNIQRDIVRVHGQAYWDTIINNLRDYGFTPGNARRLAWPLAILGGIYLADTAAGYGASVAVSMYDRYSQRATKFVTDLMKPATDTNQPEKPEAEAPAPEKKEEEDEKWVAKPVPFDKSGLLRPEMFEGGSNLVVKMNESKDTQLVDQLMWGQFNNYNWEGNQQSDNPLFLKNLVEYNVRMTGPFLGDDDLPQQELVARDIMDKPDFDLLVYKTNEPLQKDATESFMPVVPYVGQAATTDVNQQMIKSSAEVDLQFHDVFLPDWYTLGDQSAFKQMTASDGTQLTDSENDTGSLDSYWWQKNQYENQFIFETTY